MSHDLSVLSKHRVVFSSSESVHTLFGIVCHKFFVAHHGISLLETLNQENSAIDPL